MLRDKRMRRLTPGMRGILETRRCQQRTVRTRLVAVRGLQLERRHTKEGLPGPRVTVVHQRHGRRWRQCALRVKGIGALHVS